MSYWNIQSSEGKETSNTGTTRPVDKTAYSDREEFARKNPEIAAEQNREWNKKIGRFIAVVSISVAAAMGVYYLKNTNFEDVPKTPVVKNQK